jgi:hypothetical protein
VLWPSFWFPSILSNCFIHRSAWKRNSRKSISSSLQAAPGRIDCGALCSAPMHRSQRYMCVSSAWISAVVNGRGSSTHGEVELSLVGGLPPPRLCVPSRACHNWFAKEAARRNPRTLDPSLTPTRTQYPVIVGNAGNRKPFVYARFANPCNLQQPLTAHS